MQEIPAGIKIDGDCYEVVGHFAMDLKSSGKPLDDWRVVHGVVHGESYLTGIEFTHAWMELGKERQYRLVFDYSNDRFISMLATDYYSRGQIEAKNVRRYTVKEALKQMVNSGHFGPWDDFFKEWP